MNVRTIVVKGNNKVKIGTFKCVTRGADKEIRQGIYYSDGSCITGVDVFRLLNKNDFNSYETYTYSSIDAMKQENIVIEDNPFKAYYINTRKEQRI